MTDIQNIPLPSIRELGLELTSTSRTRLLWTLSTPFAAAASYFVFAARGLWVPALLSVMLLTFLSYGSTSHELVHRNLGIPPKTNDALLRLLEMISLRSGTAYRLSHLQHHRHFPGEADVEGFTSGGSWLLALLSGPTHQFRLWTWAWGARPKYRRALALEAAWFVTMCLFAVGEAMRARWALPGYVTLVIAGSWTLPLMTVYLPHDPKGAFPLAQTRAFRGLFFDLVALGHLYHLEHHLYPMVPNHHWRKLAAKLDPYFARAGVVPVRFPLSGMATNLRTYLTTRRRRFSFLAGKMEVFFIGGPLADFVPLLFGESFWMILYDGWLVDPGGTRMARSVVKHLDALEPDAVRGIVATHGHEEHVGNVALASTRSRAPIWAHAACEALLRAAPRISRMRSLVIGQPAPYAGPVMPFSDRLRSSSTTFEVYPAPGHSDDHVVLYDPQERLLLSGDAFVSTTSPNSDVDSLMWLETLRQLATLDIEVIVTGHGQIYTLRDDFPDLSGVVIRRHPRSCIAEKIRFLERMRDEIQSATEQGLSVREIEGMIFPRSDPRTWQNLAVDEVARCLSGGEFSRTELVRTFLRQRSDRP